MRFCSTPITSHPIHPSIHPSIPDPRPTDHPSMAGSSTELIMRSFICRICCCGPLLLLLPSFVHIMRVCSVESRCSGVLAFGCSGALLFRGLWVPLLRSGSLCRECGQFSSLRAFFFFFVCFCFSFKLNANKFAFFCATPRQQPPFLRPSSSNCSKCGTLWGG